MVARFLRLRVAMMGAEVRGTPAHVVRALLARALLIGCAVLVALAPVWLSTAQIAELAALDVVVGAVLLLAALIVPLYHQRVVFDARNFAQFALSPARVTLLKLCTTLVSWWGIAGIAWAVAWGVSRAALLDAALMWAAPIMQLITFAVFSCLSHAIASRFLEGRRARALLATLGAVLAGAGVPLLVLMFVIGDATAHRQTLADLARVWSQTPLGASLAAAHHTDEAFGLGAEALLALQLMTIALLVGLTVWVSRGAQQRAWLPQRGDRDRLRSGWFDMLPATPTMGVAARSLTYWMKDSRYWVATIAIPVVPIPVLLILTFVGVDSELVGLILLPIVMLLVGWTIHNDVAHDSTAFWLHVASGLRGWQDRLGRLIPVLMLGAPVLLIGASFSLMLIGDWRRLPTVLSVGFVALAASLATSSIASVLRPYPATRPGESPFVQPLWNQSGAGAAQTISLGGAALLTAPAVWAALQINEWLLMTLAVGYGATLIALGTLIGGLVFSRRSSELLAFTMLFD